METPIGFYKLPYNSKQENFDASNLVFISYSI